MFTKQHSTLVMTMQNSAAAPYIACPACDLLHRRGDLCPGTTARCTRCGSVLYRDRDMQVDRPLALVLAGLVLFFIANYYPFLTFELEGRVEETILISGIKALYGQGQLGLAILVLLTGMVFPLLQLVGLAYLLLPLRLGMVPPAMAVVYRWLRHIQPWSMMEIMMLGILVSLVKLVGMAQVVAGPALFAFMALIFVLPAATIAMDSKSIWESNPLKPEG
ncbi:MAG: paraquat-inducible protein A [Desulfobacteraceae bacterium]|jgi:paraquat-inducible protein A